MKLGAGIEKNTIMPGRNIVITEIRSGKIRGKKTLISSWLLMKLPGKSLEKKKDT